VPNTLSYREGSSILDIDCRSSVLSCDVRTHPTLSSSPKKLDFRLSGASAYVLIHLNSPGTTVGALAATISHSNLKSARDLPRRDCAQYQ
jgi:hypothetical protein